MPTAPALSPTGRVLSDVDDERARQNAKWGEQNHPDGTGPATEPLNDLWGLLPDGLRLDDATAVQVSAAATATTDVNAGLGHVTWRDILLEEVFEALAEDDPARLRTELVQVAAVAVQWAEGIDRRKAAAAAPS